VSQRLIVAGGTAAGMSTAAARQADGRPAIVVPEACQCAPLTARAAGTAITGPVLTRTRP
jgi:hypothetical protein